MKPPISRVRRTLLILGACWMVLSTAWVARRWYAVRILEKDAQYGMLCEWQLVRGEDHEEQARWAMLWPTSHIRKLGLYRASGYPPRLAWAVKVCARLEEIEIRKSPREMDEPMDPREVGAFLAGLGSQPELRTLTIEEVDLTDAEVGPLLARSPRLRELGLNLTDCTGANFPVLKELESVGTYFSPISDAGLAVLLRCPALQTINIRYGEITRAGILQIPQLRQPALKELYLHRARVSKSEAEELAGRVQLECLDLDIEVEGSVGGAGKGEKEPGEKDEE
jgi:hypothetical protein